MTPEEQIEREYADHQTELVIDWRYKYERQRELSESLAAALNRYGHHDLICNCGEDPNRDCDICCCGFRAALAIEGVHPANDPASSPKTQVEANALERECKLSDQLAEAIESMNRCGGPQCCECEQQLQAALAQHAAARVPHTET